MKYEVIGWTHCGNDKYPPHEGITASVDKAIITEIRKHKYLFGGDAHEDYCPVLNDGTYVSYSWRGWGRIIALAYGVKGDYSYTCAYMDALIKPKARNYPEELPDDSRIVPGESLTETFVMHLADDMFDKVKAGTKTVEIRLFDDKRKEVDIGDYIEFIKQSDENERIIKRVADLSVWATFKDAFVCTSFANKKHVETLRFTPEQLGSPANSGLSELVGGMYKYYTKAQETEHGAVAFTLEEPAHCCRTKLRVFSDGDECLDLYDQKLDEAADDKEFERLCAEALDEDLIEAALSDIGGDCKRLWTCFEYGENREYDVDVNVMLRKTLRDFFGKEDKLKEIRDKYCAIIRLEIFSLIVKDSEQPKQILSLDGDIIEFLHKSGVQLKFGYRVV